MTLHHIEEHQMARKRFRLNKGGRPRIERTGRIVKGIR